MTDREKRTQADRELDWATGRELERKDAEIERLQAALESIAGFGRINLQGEYEHGLRDIIRSMVGCARSALEQKAGK